MIARIGLTGGIGSGKSTVAAEFETRGACVVDTDAIARALTQPGGEAIPAVAAAFGREMIDERGALDRDRMRALVFADPSAKQRLEALLHPLIGQQADRLAAQASSSVVVFDVPLLTERPHWRERVDRIVVVDCPEPVQIRRVVARSGWTADMVAQVIAQQAGRAQRRAIADAVIHNDDSLSLDDLRKAVGRLWQAWAEAVPTHVEQ